MDRCRRSGEKPEPAASVFTAEKGGERRHFMLIDGQPKEVASWEEGFGAMLTAPDPDRTVEVKAQQVHLHRFGLYWSGYDPEYAPKTAEQLAAARVKREEKAVEKEALRNPLFADVIRAEGFVRRKGKSNRHRSV